MTKAADDFEAIRRRIEELKAERDLALTGTTVPVEDPKETKEFDIYGMYAYPTGFGDLKSTAHPEWPYAGTAHEWRGFVLGGPGPNRKLGE